MKKFVWILSIALICICTGCGEAAVESEKPQIYTSFYALCDFAKEIAGDKADIYNLVPAGAEPHDWEPTAKDMAKLNSADILFYNGLGMEAWIEKAQNSLSGSDVIFAELSEGVTTNEESGDPHIWLDPENVKIMCQNVYNALCKADPDNQMFYAENLARYETELELLNEKYKEDLSLMTNRSIVVSHEAYSYMCNAYGLTQVPIDGIAADSEPSPAKVNELISYINENDIKYIFYEELVSQKVAQTIAEETNCKLIELNPFEGLSQEQIDSGENYISVMYSNLENIKTALSGTN